MRTAGSILQTRLGPVEAIVEGNGIPVVVLHGSPGGIDSADIMSSFLPRDRFRVLLVSWPGYLGTELLNRGSVDTQADLIAALLDSVNIERSAVFGWSGGGPAAYRFAVRHPDRVSAVVTTAAVSKPIDIPALDATSRFLFNTAVGIRLMRLLAARQPEKVVSSTLASEGDLTPEQLKHHTADVMGDESKRQFVLDLSATVSQKGARKAGYDADIQQFKNLPDLDLEAIKASTLLVHGDVDTDVPPEHTIHAGGLIAGARIRMLTTGTHLALWTHADAASAQDDVMSFMSEARS